MPSVKDYRNGKYRVICCNGYLPNGKLNRFSTTITAKSMRDAEKQASVLEVHFKEGSLSQKTPSSREATFSQLVDRWRELKTGDLAEKTRERYEGMLKDFMLPAFGNRKLSKISALEIEQYLNSLKQAGVRKDGKPGGYSQKTILSHYTILHKLFNLALKWDMVQSNVCVKVDRPIVDAKEASFYQEEEIVNMLSCLSAEAMMYQAYVLIALVSACRRSEVLGLEWNDIDFERNVITVRRTSHYTAERGIYTQDKLKNGQASKTLTMPDDVMDFLKRYKLTQDSTRAAMGNQWIPCNRLFIAETGGSITPAGGPIHPDNISQWFERFLLKNGLPRITLHQVRHTSISFLLNSGVDVDTVAKRAGHKNSQITSSIYGHVFDKNMRDSANKFSGLLKKADIT